MSHGTKEAPAIPVFYRVVRSNPPTTRDLASRAWLGFAIPAGADAETLRFHTGISTMDTEAGARTLARRYRDQGAFIAAIDSARSASIQYRRTGWVGHVTVWAPPDDILAAVVSVVDV